MQPDAQVRHLAAELIGARLDYAQKGATHSNTERCETLFSQLDGLGWHVGSDGVLREAPAKAAIKIHMIEVRGAVPWAASDVGDMKDGQFPANFMLCCAPVFEGGRLVAIEFGPIEYHFSRYENPTTGAVAYAAQSRPVAERGKYPNWPNAEPEAA